MTNKYDYVAQSPAASPEIAIGSARSYSEKQFLHSWVAGALLPLMQAFISMIVAMILTAATIYLFDGWQYGKPMIGVGVFTFVTYWILAQMRWWKLTAEKLASSSQVQTQPAAAPPPRSVRVEIREVTEQGHVTAGKYIDFTGFADEQEVFLFAKGVTIEKRGLGERLWTPKKTNVFAVNKYRAFRQECVKRGLIEPAKNADGFQLTRVGETVFKRVYEELKGEYE